MVAARFGGANECVRQMRLSDDDFLLLSSLSDFESYYSELSVSEMIDELERLHSDLNVKRALFQNISMHKKFLDIACFDETLNELQRSSIIGITTNMRDTIDRLILPYVEIDMAERVRTAMASGDEYVDRFGYYPRAVEMIRLGARKPVGPYELGPVGESLSRNSN